MTGFTTRCSRRLAEILGPIAQIVAFVFALTCAGVSSAQEARFGYAAVQPADDSYVLEADVLFDLSDQLEDAVQRGVPLYLVVEVEITRDRWYWLDERMVRRKRTYRLTYHPLTRSYQLAEDGNQQSFDTLEEALAPLRKIRGWVIIPRKKLAPGTSYDAAIRFRLDTSRLPKPFQVTALASSEWTLDTDWLQWTFLATARPIP
ncbi:MAG: DUF4390 domain-containing protein [Rhodocyclaceae bacterium]|nr:DUF4390 domain-containing protein [Rhodocyclaceae bacterium]